MKEWNVFGETHFAVFVVLFYEMEDADILNPDNEEDLYILHYIFIPRINVQLIQFLHAWNNHHIRTELGLTPLQLWHRGMLSADLVWQQEIASGFTASPDYGIEDGCFVNCFDQPHVVIPRICVIRSKCLSTTTACKLFTISTQ